MNNEMIQQALDIGIAIARENDYNKLLTTIIRECSKITHCDAGTLYLLKDNKLHFMVMLNHTFHQYLGETGEPISIPPVEINLENVCSYVALTKKNVNIPDVYHDDSFNWKGPKKYDELTGYHTQSMIVIPLIDKDGEVIGVMQLLNAMEDGHVIPFSQDMEYVVYSVASQAAMILSNMLLKVEIEDVLDSMVSGLTTAIDSRTPYNANHSKNVAELCLRFSRFAKDNDYLDLSENDIEQLHMAASLHDVGKMIIPLGIMDKSTRLDTKLPMVEMRLKYIRSLIRLDGANHVISEHRMTELLETLEKMNQTIHAVNTAGFLTDELEEQVRQMITFTYSGVPLLEEEEIEDLLIKRGTLTLDERNKIENHAVYTHEILSKIRFGKKYNKVLYYASTHHEYLNGTGYPNHLTAEDLPICSRILTMMDVFESLTAKDRPYKKAMPVEKAYSIVCAMVEEGKLDGTLVTLLGTYLKSTGDLSHD